jgi:protein-S-isoprenylcysteine O-methyltransferase Ste14
VLLWVGLVFAAAAFVSLRRAVKLSPYPRPDARLVENGIYRYLRHPMYSSAVVCSIGLVLVVPRFTVLAAAVGVTVFYLVKARYEESVLLAHYPGYAHYRARTLGVLFTRGR